MRASLLGSSATGIGWTAALLPTASVLAPLGDVPGPVVSGVTLLSYRIFLTTALHLADHVFWLSARPSGWGRASPLLVPCAALHVQAAVLSTAVCLVWVRAAHVLLVWVLPAAHPAGPLAAFEFGPCSIA